MSDLPLKADIRQREWHVRLVPKADIIVGSTRLSLVGCPLTIWSLVAWAD